MDRITRYITRTGGIMACAIDSTYMVATAQEIHRTSPVATAALGRLMTAASMMGSMLKKDGATVTLKANGGGPLGSVVAIADSNGNCKGYAEHPEVVLPLKPNGKLDVGGALGIGVLSVIRDIGLKEPYVGQTILVSGEIAEDLTYYYATSEQVPSSVALGVLMNKDNTVRQAGGFIIQLMPGASDDCIDRLEARLGEMSSITALLDAGKTPEEILEDLLGDMGLEILDRLPARFHCDCHKSRVARAITSIGKKELQSMIDEGKPIEVSCHFCNKIYTFTVDELKEMLEKATRP